MVLAFGSTIKFHEGLGAEESIVESLLVGIPKPSGGIRPIAVGLTIHHLARKVALKLVTDELSAHLQPLQLGVGVLHGTEAIVHCN